MFLPAILVAAALIPGDITASRVEASEMPRSSGQAPSEPKPPPSDPATLQFETPAGLLLVAVRPDRAKDYEAAIVALQGALASAPEPAYQELARGWRVFKARETDAKKNTLYVHLMMPVSPDADYRPSLLLDELLLDPPDDLLTAYAEAFAAPPTKLSLTELADMSVMPVEPPEPVETGPAKTAPPKPPGGSR